MSDNFPLDARQSPSTRTAKLKRTRFFHTILTQATHSYRVYTPRFHAMLTAERTMAQILKSNGKWAAAASGYFITGKSLFDMAWYSHGKNNDDMVDALKRNDIVKSKDVEESMKAVDRGIFVTDKAYVDSPQPIGYQATISAPHMHAHCLELMADVLKPGARVLDVGSGSGYLTAILLHMVLADPKSKVVGIEHIPQLVDSSTAALQKMDFTKRAMASGNLSIVKGNGKLGYAECSPYDCIHVGAAAAKIPMDLVDQLRVGGRMVIPVGLRGGTQILTVVNKLKDGGVSTRNAMQVMYVPLTSVDDQLGHGLE